MLGGVVTVETRTFDMQWRLERQGTGGLYGAAHGRKNGTNGEWENEQGMLTTLGALSVKCTHPRQRNLVIACLLDSPTYVVLLTYVELTVCYYCPLDQNTCS